MEKKKRGRPRKNPEKECYHEWVVCNDNFGDYWVQCKLCNRKLYVVNIPPQPKINTNKIALQWFIVGVLGGWTVLILYFLLFINDICISL